jgi:hypothetical protein
LARPICWSFAACCEPELISGVGGVAARVRPRLCACKARLLIVAGLCEVHIVVGVGPELAGAHGRILVGKRPLHLEAGAVFHDVVAKARIGDAAVAVQLALKLVVRVGLARVELAVLSSETLHCRC